MSILAIIGLFAYFFMAVASFGAMLGTLAEDRPSGLAWCFLLPLAIVMAALWPVSMVIGFGMKHAGKPA